MLGLHLNIDVCGLGPKVFITVAYGLFVRLAHGISGTPTGSGDGDRRNAPIPGSPDGDAFLPVNIPAGTKITPFTSPNG